MAFRNYYDVLQVANDATQDEIKKAYRSLAKIWHPDINKSSEANEKMKSITEAYAILSNVDKRKEYDEKNAKEFNNLHNSNEKAYASYTKSREESESDFDEWLKEYLKVNLNNMTIIELINLKNKIIKKYNEMSELDYYNILTKKVLSKKYTKF